MKGCNFTLEHYKEILETARNGWNFSDFLNKEFSEKVIYLRHDIDVSLRNALALAEIEKEVGVCSTFFVRINSPFYNALSFENINILKRISRMRHNIGLHYDREEIKEEDVEKEHRLLSNFINVDRVVSFHRPSEDLLGLNLKNFTSVYSDYFFRKIEYISDSNRALKRGCILEFLKKHPAKNIQILVHPFWWNERTMELRDLYEKLKEETDRETREALRKDMKCYKSFKF